MKHQILVLALLSGLTACGSGGGSDDPADPLPAPSPAPPPASAELSIADGTVLEGDAGQTAVEFVLTLSEALPDTATVDAQTIAASSGTLATSGVDFEATAVTVRFAAGDTSESLTVTVFGDTDEESDERFAVQLSNPSSALTLTNDTATGTIRNDDNSVVQQSEGYPLNDTGITNCADGTDANSTCGSASGAYPGQDGESGRDLSDSNDADGLAGFSFTKIGDDGTELVNQTQSYEDEPWGCVQDNVTGLTWETKKPIVQISPAAVRATNALYSWYDPDQGAFSGSPNAGFCGGSDCDTSSYRDLLNRLEHCGYNDWRVPTRRELLSIVNFGTTDQPVFEPRFFPHTVSTYSYWTSSAGVTPSERFAVSAWDGASEATGTTGKAINLRLVRGSIR